MQVEKTDLPGVMILTPARHGDARGWFSETYNAKRFDAAVGGACVFRQDNEAFSAKAGTLRGLHFQAPPSAQTKLVRCLSGAILDVAVDIRHGSPHFGQHVAVELSAANGQQLLVPQGFAHGYVTLQDDCTVAYKVDAFYDPNSEGGVHWADPDLGIDWQIDPAIITVKDADEQHPPLAALAPVFQFGEA